MDGYSIIPVKLIMIDKLNLLNEWFKTLWLGAGPNVLVIERTSLDIYNETIYFFLTQQNFVMETSNFVDLFQHF